jgi:hypothetical protein
MRPYFTVLIVSLILFLTVNSTAQRSDVVTPTSPDTARFNIVPNEYENIPGTGSFTSPLATTPRTYQMLIHESQLTNLVGKELRGIYWRIPASATANWPAAEVVYTAYDIYLSGSVDPSARSLTFVNNIVGTQKQVRSGGLTIPVDSYPYGHSPNGWGPEISFNSAWLYTGGHLLIELRTSGFTGTSRSNDAVTTSTAGYLTQFSACWASGYTATSGAQGNFAIVQIKGDDIIPVELTSFKSVVAGNSVKLTWTTATETNNKGFEIERASLNNFKSVGFVEGNATSTAPQSYSFADENLSAGKYNYRIKQIDFDGTFKYFNLGEVVEVGAPDNFSLSQNYPNPFNPNTVISWQLPVKSYVTLRVYDVLGKEAALLINEEQEAGIYKVDFSSSNLAGGTYFYRLQAGQFVQTKKMVILK